MSRPDLKWIWCRAEAPFRSLVFEATKDAKDQESLVAESEIDKGERRVGPTMP